MFEYNPTCFLAEADRYGIAGFARSGVKGILQEFEWPSQSSHVRRVPCLIDSGSDVTSLAFGKLVLAGVLVLL